MTPPCRSPGMPRGRTSTAAAQANAVMRRHPDCSEGRRRLVARSPHGHEQHARTTDATGREPRVPRSYGRYLVALYNRVRTHLALDKDAPLHRRYRQLDSPLHQQERSPPKRVPARGRHRPPCPGHDHVDFAAAAFGPDEPLAPFWHGRPSRPSAWPISTVGRARFGACTPCITR